MASHSPQCSDAAEDNTDDQPECDIAQRGAQCNAQRNAYAHWNSRAFF